jgi:predicted metal-binding membrane protein
MSTDVGRIEAVLRRDRVLIFAAVTVVAVVGWAYLGYLAWSMRAMGPMSMASAMVMPRAEHWGRVELPLLFVMWTMMMVAMMVPSAAPLVLMFARANRRKGNSTHVVGSAAMLLLGYLFVWTGFSGLAALAQWSLHNAALLSSTMASTSPLLSGLLLLAAGAYQFTPLKRACLVHCRSPLAFVTSEWRGGRWGAFLMGLKHGRYCLGCCCILMSLLLVAGVMNLLWVAALAVFVLMEKVAPVGERLGRIGGAVLVTGGALCIMTI